MCPLSIQELLESAQHKAYLQEHADEYPFPIDGSEWSRLVAARISHEHHLECDLHLHEDFWFWLHYDKSFLKHERQTYQRALHHWFLTGSDSYELPWYHSGQPTQQELAWHFLHEINKDKQHKDLAEIESEWIRGGAAAKVWLPAKSPHWFNTDPEAGESRPMRKIKQYLVDDEKSLALLVDKTESPALRISAADLSELPVQEDEQVFYLPDRSKGD